MIEFRENGAIFSPCRHFRYALWREWDSALPKTLFVALNPSTADETVNDPTMRRCIDFAKRWGYGGMLVGNIFAYRATKPLAMFSQAEPVGEKNDAWLQYLAAHAGKIIVCWGNGLGGRNAGIMHRRANHVRQILPTPIHHLGLTKQGQPKHPLYLKKTTQPRIF